MAFIDSFMRLVVSGTLYEGERFSWSLSVVRDFNDDPAPWTEVPQGIIDAVTAFHTNANVGISSNAKIDLIKWNEIGTDGRYVNQEETLLYEPVSPINGPASGTPAPQVALAVTLRTGFARGRAHAGRFYLPLPTQPIEADGALATPVKTYVATYALLMINAINTEVGAGWRVGVVSDIGLGAKHPVTYVSVGGVLDTLRSRRRSLLENYVDSAEVT